MEQQKQGSIKKIIMIQSLSTLIFSSVNCFAQPWLWAEANGASYVAGSFEGNMRLGTLSIVASINSELGDIPCMFIAR